MDTVTIKVKNYVEMLNPYSNNTAPQKIRFCARLSDVPELIIDWMTTNPREQNLTSSVAKAIAASIEQDSMDFHLKNRGILLSVKTAKFIPDQPNSKNGEVSLYFEDSSIHGNIDGGHTFRLILASHNKKDLPEQYVEFEVLVGLDDILPIAEARNTSVALDIRSMEEMKGSFDILKSIYSNTEINGDKFFDRVEMKMNQQLEEANHIDIRTLISIILMFNQELYPNPAIGIGDIKDYPIQIYGNKEAALKKYLSLGNGDTEKRNESIAQMTPILEDIVKLWDTIERELPLVYERKYKQLSFTQRARNPVSLFSNTPIKYAVPQAIMFPIIAAFRTLVTIDENGNYKWEDNPFEA